MLPVGPSFVFALNECKYLSRWVCFSVFFVVASLSLSPFGSRVKLFAAKRKAFDANNGKLMGR